MVRRMSLRSRLMVLVLAALLPVAALSVWSAWSASRDAVRQAQESLRLNAALVAAQHDSLSAAAQHLLAVITAVPEIRSLGRRLCQDYFERLRGRYPIYANIGLLDARGDLICHAAANQGGFNAADRDYFRDAVATRRFAMGQLATGRVTRRAVLPFALPVIEAGQVQGVAFVTLDVGQMQADFNRTTLPAGVRLVLADGAGRVILERDSGALPPREPGTALRSPALHAAARAMVPGDAVDIGRDERQRLFAFVPTQPVGERRLLAVASMDYTQLTATAWRGAYQQLALLAAVLLIGLGLAAWLGRRMIAQPTSQLAATAERLGHGDLDARVALPPEGAGNEFARIAQALNHMASSLQLRQRQLEGELQNSRHAYSLLNTVVNQMREGVVAATLQGRVLLRNEAILKLAPQARPASMADRPRVYGMYRGDGSELLPPEEQPLARACRGESGQMLVFVRNDRVPEGRLLQCSFQPLPDQEGEPAGLTVTTDITDLKRSEVENARLVSELSALNQDLEQRIAQRTDALMQANRELEAFSYSVSHDLRAPLAAVDGFARALADRLAGHEDAKARHYLQRIQAGAVLMEQLIQGLLQLARLVRQPMAYQPVDLSALAHETLDWLQQQDPARQVRIEVQDGLAAQGDAPMLRTVMQNLLGNAWKFTASTEGARIEVGRQDHEAGGPVFYVRDNGVGFDMAHASRLFTAFQRLHTASEFPGTGIGLATVQRVIVRHQGRIWAEAAPGRGCTVYFSLGPAPADEPA